MSWRPFVNLTVENGEIKTSQIPKEIRCGSWFLLVNKQVTSGKNPNERFASSTRHELHNRRVILAENPTLLPRLQKVLVRTTSKANAHRNIEHPDHAHLQIYPNCCCLDQKHRDSYVTKQKWHVSSIDMTISAFRCNEPTNSDIWQYL
jgi:hypothetical protein